MKANEKNLLREVSCFIGHSLECEDEYQNSCFKRINSLLSETLKNIDTKQLFFTDEESIATFITLLPSDAENLLVRIELGEEPHVLTQEVVTDMWYFWKNSMQFRKNLASIFGNDAKQLRRFSLTLNYLFAMESFLRSSNRYLLTFEDDAWLEDAFPSTVTSLLSDLPSGWDVFNFIVPSDECTRFNESLKVNDYIAEGYQTWSAASLLWSRKGVKKVLSRLALDVNYFELGDPHGDQQMDSLIANMVMSTSLNGPGLDYHVVMGKSRPFQTYTFVPEYKSPVSQNLNIQSTLSE